MTTVDAPVGATPKGRSRKKAPQFKGRDKWVFYAMVGIPTGLHVLLVWVPTIAAAVRRS